MDALSHSVPLFGRIAHGGSVSAIGTAPERWRFAAQSITIPPEQTPRRTRPFHYSRSLPQSREYVRLPLGENRTVYILRITHQRPLTGPARLFWVENSSALPRLKLSWARDHSLAKFCESEERQNDACNPINPTSRFGSNRVPERRDRHRDPAPPEQRSRKHTSHGEKGNRRTKA